MKATNYLFFCYVLFQFKLSFAERGVCIKRTSSGNSKNVCCADFEEKNSECKPCETGYTSYIGTVCRPCPPNTFGFVCASDCHCNEFERCDNVKGCVDSEATTLPVEVDQTSNYIHNHDFTTNTLEIINGNEITTANEGSDVQTTLWFFKTTTVEPSKSPGLSTREVIVYYTMSVAFLLLLFLLVCICLVIRKNKKKQKWRTVRSSRLESTNQTVENVENNDSQGIEEINVYEVIDEANINEILVKPEFISNDYLEVVTESISSKSSGSDKPHRSSYLNPYQPCVSTDATKSSYEKLQLQTMGVVGNDDEKCVDTQGVCESLKHAELLKSHENKHFNIQTIAKSRQEKVQNNKKERNLERKSADENIDVKSNYRISSPSGLNLKGDTYFDSNASQKYNTL